MGWGLKFKGKGMGGCRAGRASSCLVSPCLPCPLPGLDAVALRRGCEGGALRGGVPIVAVVPSCAVLFSNCPPSPQPRVPGGPDSLSGGQL